MNKNTLKCSALLFLTACIWGFAFVAQSVSMNYVGPFTFLCCRSFLGGFALLPLIWFRGRKKPAGRREKTPEGLRLLVTGGLCCGVFLCIASSFQQIGIQYTTIGKAGFVTALYIVIVPLLGLFFRRRVAGRVWFSVLLALVGLYLLCMKDRIALQKGDLLMLLCALTFSFQILSVDHYSPLVDGVKLSCIQFFVCGTLAGICMLLFEAPTMEGILGAAVPILYAGFLSSGVGYTLQIIAQRGLSPAVASLIMSLESVTSALAGWFILGQALTPREISGCVLMFGAIVLAQLPSRQKAVA